MINKDKNVNLQLTINKETASQLKYVIDDLSKLFNISLTKSQAIAYLINNYKHTPQTAKEPKETKQKAVKNGVNYQAQLLALRDKLGISYPHLSEIIDIPLSTLKRYVYGQQTPNDINSQKILTALKRYGIK